MLDLSLYRQERPTLTLTLRGQSVSATVLPASTVRAIRKALPAPRVTLVPDGSGGMKVAREDPAQQEADAYHGLECMAADVLVAAGNVEFPLRPTPEHLTALAAAVADLLGLVTSAEIAAAWHALRDASTPKGGSGGGGGDARGN